MKLILLVLRTGAAQFIVQLIGFVGGILVVRLLPVHEYAGYTVLIAALGTLTTLADAGIANAVMAQAGRAHGDSALSGRILATGLAYRRRFSLVVACIFAPVLMALLLRQGQGLAAAAAGVLAVGLVFAAVAQGALLEVPLKLHQQVMPLQWLQLQANTLRVTLVAAALWLLPLAPLALLCAAGTQAWFNLRLRRLVRPLTDPAAQPDAAAAAQMRRTVRRTFPGLLYYCVAGHLNVWLLALFGSATAVAEIGALGRLAVIFTVVQSTVALLVLPRFARLEGGFERLLRFFGVVALGVGAMGAMLCLVAWRFPQSLLWVLGADYSALGPEVFLMVASGAMSLLGSTFFGMNNARGYVTPAWVQPALGVSHTLALMLLLDVSTAHGVLLMQLVLAAASVFYGFLIFIHYGRQTDASLLPDT